MITISEWHTELKTRRARFWKVVQQSGCDLGLVFGSHEHPEAFRYLTNFVPVLGDMWGILSSEDRMVSLLNFHWQLEEARQASGLQEWVGVFDLIPAVLDALSSFNHRRVAVFGMQRIPYIALQAIKERFPILEWIDAGAEFNKIRQVKSPLEIRLLRQSIRITDGAINTVRAELKPGQTENEICARLTYLINRSGAELAFTGAAMTGNERDDIIRLPTDRPLQKGESLMIDYGAAYQGYQADVGRTYVIGNPNDLQKKVWDTVCRAHDAVIALAKPGVPCNALHQAALCIISNAGFVLKHRIGHGIGLATSFEWPALDTETALLEAGMTLAIEPGIYIQGAGAMKYEDDILITESGCEVLSNCSPEWIVPG